MILSHQTTIQRNIISDELCRIYDSIFIKKLLLLLILLTVSYQFILTEKWYFSITGVILTGILYAHAIELQHQCLHNSAFNNRKINRLIGFLLGLPMLVSFNHYQVNHMHHHRYLGTKNDVEFFTYTLLGNNIYTRLLFNAFNWKRYLTVIKIIIFVLIRKNIHVDANRYKLNLIKYEYLLILFISILLLLFTITTQNYFFVKIWIIPVLFVSEPIHFLIELPEHFGCDRQKKDAFSNTRTIIGSKLSMWLTNGNNYHVEHHLFPAIPISTLPKVHKEIAQNIIYLNKSYFQFYKHFIRISKASLARTV